VVIGEPLNGRRGSWMVRLKPQDVLFLLYPRHCGALVYARSAIDSSYCQSCSHCGFQALEFNCNRILSIEESASCNHDPER
jgi:hypothetical protein